MSSLGIIGYGHFGEFLANKLSPHFDLKVYSHSGKANQWTATQSEVAACDYVVLSVPLTKHLEVCRQLKPLLAEHTVIVDVCSVKEESGKIIKAQLPDQPLISIHPLFGPESAWNSLKGHTVVICPDITTGQLLQPCEDFCNKLGLQVVKMTSDQHDQNMALVQGLTFFVARTLKDFDLNSSMLKTPSFKKLVALAELEAQHTKELFITVQNGSPYVQAVRQHFIDRAQELHDLLVDAEIPE